ncbi:hypothetical protein MNEG_7608 [Monoraphidium neglectum]|jgi:enoyl-CoA hydratase|uniref:3-hydroxyisobutyryl-CoA hydrolase n=1 Tax=Monoraphidium neglectum TaxID=145388 RepID=A0A0D2KYR9_9CHLO|nr:hypothetical protein MNEG_7608 [Monoraphidium neglectum]KIZ00354.1 hypothetical protein MNEG_7608 [Monoraphidium neglectum]|eukprot:XP_013899373.1 hypothetical protein MNEG_7608 [Monoraphidium neglectum]
MPRFVQELAACSASSGCGSGDGSCGRGVDQGEAADLLRAALAALRSSSPGSQVITLRHYAALHAAAVAAEAAGPAAEAASAPPLVSLRDVMSHEYRMAVRRVAQPDFLEGVRALLVDKDRCPKWRPRDLEEVDADVAPRLAAPLPAGTGGLDLGETDTAVLAASRRLD